MTPKFSVGEVVILQSRTRPECNGEYTVVIVAHPGGRYIDPNHGGTMKNSSAGIGYVLDDPNLISAISEGIASAQWAESALRKKHQPGELSYTDLLESLTVKSGAPA